MNSQLNFFKPFAILPNVSPIPSGIVTPDHFVIESAKSPNGFANVANASALIPLAQNLLIPPAKLPICAPRFSGTVTPDHFVIESAKSPNGFATFAIASAPKPLNVNSITPFARPVNALSK